MYRSLTGRSRCFRTRRGGMKFLKLRGATMVHHASKPVNQCISIATQEVTFFAKWHGRRALWQEKLNIAISTVEKVPATIFKLNSHHRLKRCCRFTWAWSSFDVSVVDGRIPAVCIQIRSEGLCLYDFLCDMLARDEKSAGS